MNLQGKKGCAILAAAALTMPLDLEHGQAKELHLPHFSRCRSLVFVFRKGAAPLLPLLGYICKRHRQKSKHVNSATPSSRGLFNAIGLEILTPDLIQTKIQKNGIFIISVLK